MHCNFAKLYGPKQIYETFLVDLGCESVLYKSNNLTFLLFPLPSPLPLLMLQEHTGLWRVGFPLPFYRSSLFFLFFHHLLTQGHRRGMLKVCSSLFGSFLMRKISGDHFSEFRRLPVHHLQFSCWCDMCITFRFFRQLHHVTWYIHNICNAIHETSCGISHTSIFTESQNTKASL